MKKSRQKPTSRLNRKITLQAPHARLHFTIPKMPSHYQKYNLLINTSLTIPILHYCASGPKMTPKSPSGFHIRKSCFRGQPNAHLSPRKHNPQLMGANK